MAQNITRSVEELLAEANAEIDGLSAEAAKALHGHEGYVFVDLRDIRELYRSGKIPGAFACPRGMLEFWIDPNCTYHKPIFNQDKTYVFYCASGWRSALSAKTAQDMGLSPVMHIEGGFGAWTDAGGPTEEVEKR